MVENGMGGEAVRAESRWLERSARMRGQGWRCRVAAESGATNGG